ncbi:MAG TPA: tryptophan 2,3-dioxygenase family protein [Candidatus Aquilonibacter sp.]|jgi:aminocarboxymuconate-semialdehyde decarboxylase|nr:tryptophan 2,3-dioxygenase family protein [Candidatus Aquilonibacter sp.]
MTTKKGASVSTAAPFTPANSMPAIDIHNHFFPNSWPDLAARYRTPNWPWIKHTGPGKADIMVGDRFFRKICSACWDPEVRLREMDRDGINMQVISATPVLFAYDRPIEHALDCAQLFNDAALELCNEGKGRLKSLCQVPLQDTDAACKELSRCMKTGHLGVQIGNHIGSKNLDDAGVVTFLHHCADEGAAVLVHPWEMFGQERMPKYMMPWTVGMPAETQLSVVAMILSGAFDRLPEKLRICFAHGGGSFAFLLGRLENAWHHHPVARGECKHPPSYYLNRFYVDSAVFDQRALQFLVGTMGTDRVMLGSDYPFPLGEEHVGSLIRQSNFPQQIKNKLLSENAVTFLHLTMEPSANSVKSSATGVTTAPVTPEAGQLTYSSYLKVPDLLDLQQPQSSPIHHDEMLFIVVHQTYELWFKELLHDLDAVVTNLQRAAANPKSHDEVYEAARLLRRCTEITRVLVEQFTILETMLPTHFLAFRGLLEPASGFQSEQFREIEFLCGLKDDKMLRYHRPTPEAHARLKRRLEEPSLHDAFFGALQAMGKLPTPDNDATERAKFEARARAVHELYQDEQHHRDWIDVCERLTEFDELIVSWRLRHIQLVERIIGIRMGTGGSAGASYLKLTLDKKFFPELWEARTLLTE